MTTATPAAGELWFARYHYGSDADSSVPALVMVGRPDSRTGEILGEIDSIHRDAHGSIPLRFASCSVLPIGDPRLVLIAQVDCPNDWLWKVEP